jgi:hypothetical protein
MSERDDGLIEIRQTYTTMLNGRVIVIHDVPMLQDPDTQEMLLSPETAQQLYELLNHPEYKTGIMTAEVYTWDRTPSAA